MHVRRMDGLARGRSDAGRAKDEHRQGEARTTESLSRDRGLQTHPPLIAQPPTSIAHVRLSRGKATRPLNLHETSNEPGRE